ncbi:MAG: glycosyltransferase family 1 protein [Acidobacteria bacterium]|nr:MAG: glycosyltransferase family 1 protein [Acidobacteriota bacterium]
MSLGTGELALAEVDDWVETEAEQEPRDPGLKVGVVAYEMEGQPTGVGRYLEGLLNGVAAGGRPWHWVLFFKGEPFDHPLWSETWPRAVGEESEGPTFRPIFDQRPAARPILWEQLRLPVLLRRQPLDVIFSPSYSLPPWPRLPALVTVHDLSFEHLPDAFPFRERQRRRLLARRAVRQARRVLADTERIAGEIERLYRVPRAKISVLPLAVDRRFHAPSTPDALAPLGLEPPYLLAIGTILARRRLDLVLQAFADVAGDFPDLRLVIAGRNRLVRPADLDGWIAASGAGERVVRLGYVEERFLPALYRHAEASFYLSTYEGFGLPPLESLAAGTPAIVGPRLGLDDLWPDYPYRCTRLERPEVAAVLRRLLHDEIERHRVERQGPRRMAELTWERAGSRLMAEVERALTP